MSIFQNPNHFLEKFCCFQEMGKTQYLLLIIIYLTSFIIAKQLRSKIMMSNYIEKFSLSIPVSFIIFLTIFS
jgi:hypothetical protein